MSMHCTAHSAAESRPWPERDAGEALSRITPALPAFLRPAIATARLCFALPRSCSPRLPSRHATCTHAHSMQRTKELRRQKCKKKGHHRLRQPCEHNNQVVWQGCRRLVQGLCAVQVNGRVRGVPVSFRRESWTTRTAAARRTPKSGSSRTSTLPFLRSGRSFDRADLG